MAEMECPNCSGLGEVTVTRFTGIDYCNGSAVEASRRDECPDCDGYGFIADEDDNDTLEN